MEPPELLSEAAEQTRCYIVRPTPQREGVTGLQEDQNLPRVKLLLHYMSEAHF